MDIPLTRFIKGCFGVYFSAGQNVYFILYCLLCCLLYCLLYYLLLSVEVSRTNCLLLLPDCFNEMWIFNWVRSWENKNWCFVLDHIIVLNWNRYRIVLHGYDTVLILLTWIVLYFSIGNNIIGAAVTALTQIMSRLTTDKIAGWF